MNNCSWRSQYPVLVAEVQTIGSIGVIRSLGRSGYPVHACSSEPDALGFLSNFAHASAVCPSYRSPQFLPWLRKYIHSNGILAIIPSESMLLALRPAFSEFAPLLPMSQDESIVYRGLSKFDLFSSFLKGGDDSDIGSHLPSTILVDNLESIPSIKQLREIGEPLYIKTDGLYSKNGERGFVYIAANAEKAYVALTQLRPRFHKALIQGHVQEQGVGAFFLLWKGQVLAEFMHRRLHEVPHTGGVSSLRESWWHQGIRDDALLKLTSLGWEGVVMMEYRWDSRSDQFWLMEMNGRFWGSLHLPLYAGIDFPRILLDAFHGKTPKPVKKFPLHIRCRLTYPNEVQYVWSRLKDKNIALSSRMWSILEFCMLSLSPYVYSDLLFPGDNLLFWKSFVRFFRDSLPSRPS